MRAGQAPPSDGRPPDQDDRALLERLRRPPEPWWVRSRAGVVAAAVALVLVAGGIAVVLYVAHAGQRSADAQWQATLAKNATANAPAFASVTAEAQATGTAAAALATVGAAGTATASSRQPTAAPSAPAVSSTVAPTAAPNPTLAPRAPAGGQIYVADFASWPHGELPVPESVRGTYDVGSKAYILALTDAKRGYVYWLTAPDGPRIDDFQLDVDVRRITGPDTGAYGVVFRVQAPGPNDKTAARYNFLVFPNSGSFALTRTDANGIGTEIAYTTLASTLHQGDATNHLTLVARGTTLTLTINGTVVGTYQIEHADAGKAGLIVLNPSNAVGPAAMAAAYSNFRVSVAPASGAVAPTPTGITH